MKLFYKAISLDGKKFGGIIEAKDQREASIFLRKKELVPIEISLQRKPLFRILQFLQRSRNSHLVFFTRQLSLMLSSGLTLMQSLTILKDQVQSIPMGEVVEAITADIQGGSSFSSSLAKHPSIFSPIYISLIKSAEASGLLDKVLLKLADNLEKREKLITTIKGALIYPAVVICMMIAVIVIMLVFVIPPLTRLYVDLDVAMPLPTLIILGLSSFLINFWPFILGVFVLSIYLFRRWHKTENGRLVFDKYILKVPVFGSLIQKKILAEFTRRCGLLVGTGVLVVDSLDQSSETTGNLIYRNGIIDVSRMVQKGITVGDAMSAYDIFPPILIQMAKIGEQTGKLDESMLRVSEYFELEVDQMVKNLTTLLEPFIIVILGVGVGFLIISIITPIYGLIANIK